MEKLPYHPLVIVTQEDLQKARELYGVQDINSLRESLDILEKWLQKQPHLAEGSKYLSPANLERAFITAKGSVEETKRRLERMFTSRGMMPELCLNRTVEEFKDEWEVVNYVPLPKICPSDRSRVMVTQFLTEKLEKFSILAYFRLCFMVGEYRLNFDYTPAERFIIDFKNIHIGLLIKINPVVVKKAEVLCTEGIGTKIKGIHILNAPTFVDKIIHLLKQALREKLANRIHVHSTYEDLHKYIPKEILPKDYGGDEESCSKLSEKWKKLLRQEEARKIIQDTEKLVSDETKRHESKFNEEYMGMPGSFRRLAVD